MMLQAITTLILSATPKGIPVENTKNHKVFLTDFIISGQKMPSAFHKVLYHNPEGVVKDIQGNGRVVSYIRILLIQCVSIHSEKH